MYFVIREVDCQETKTKPVTYQLAYSTNLKP